MGISPFEKCACFFFGDFQFPLFWLAGIFAISGVILQISGLPIPNEKESFTLSVVFLILTIILGIAAEFRGHNQIYGRTNEAYKTLFTLSILFMA